MREMRLVSEAGLYALMTDVCRVLELYDVSKAVSRLDDDEKRKIIESRVVVDPRLNIGSDSREINIINESGLYALMTDVCRILEIQNPTDALKRLDEDERAKFNLGRSPVHGGGGEVNIINESGLYALMTDACRVLELYDVSKAVSRLDADEKMTLDLTEGHSGQRGGAQFINIINESGLYALMTDVCRVLELDDVSKAVSRLDADEKGLYTIQSPLTANNQCSSSTNRAYTV